MSKLLPMLVGWLLSCLAFGGTPTRPSFESASRWSVEEERLAYRMKWGIIHVADARTETQFIESGGRRFLAIRIRVKTTPFVAHIFPLNDYVESLVDPETFLPVQYEQKLKEGRDFRHEIVRFDHAKRKAYWKNVTKGREGEFEIQPDTRDVVSFMWYIRTRGVRTLYAEEALKFTVVVDNQVYDLSIRGQRYEDIRLPLVGRFKALRLEPVAKFGQIFVRKGRIWLWISDDARCVCAKMAVRLKVCSLKGYLVSVTGGEQDIWSSPGPGRGRR